MKRRLAVVTLALVMVGGLSGTAYATRSGPFSGVSRIESASATTPDGMTVEVTATVRPRSLQVTTTSDATTTGDDAGGAAPASSRSWKPVGHLLHLASQERQGSFTIRLTGAPQAGDVWCLDPQRGAIPLGATREGKVVTATTTCSDIALGNGFRRVAAQGPVKSSNDPVLAA